MLFRQKTMLLCEYEHFLHYKREKNFYSKYSEDFLLLERNKTGIYTNRASYVPYDKATAIKGSEYLVSCLAINL